MQHETTNLDNEWSKEAIGCYDVICGRSKAAFDNIGNRRFRITISLSVDRYIQLKSRKDRSMLIASVAELVRSVGGRFLRRKDNQWVELSEKEAHDKTGHAFRDMAAAIAKKGDHPRRSKESNNRPSSFRRAIFHTKNYHQKRPNSLLTVGSYPSNCWTPAGPPCSHSDPPVMSSNSLEKGAAVQLRRESLRFPASSVDITSKELSGLRKMFAEEEENHIMQKENLSTENDEMLSWLFSESKNSIMQHQI